ncbi:MAG: hypothetical protein PVF28_00425 [Thioalkalispiraceae bacterium]|jgi:hypothetical protein
MSAQTQYQETLPVIIDLEASGFGFNSYPIEVGLALEDGTTHCYLIKPEPGWVHWNPDSEALHGISRDTLIKHGRSVEEVALILNQLLEGKTVYSDAWSYDQSWLNLLFVFAKIPLRFRVEALTYLLSELQLDAWTQVKQTLIDHAQFRRHRASNDALLLQRTFSVINSYGV